MGLFIEFLVRGGHILFGIAWIGLLYYFNFIQAEYMKEAGAEAKTDVFAKLAPRALWWFRWAAMFTFITGMLLLMVKWQGLTADIVVGATLGILMFLNVWLIIWPNQKIIVTSNQRVQSGGEPLPEAVAAAPKAALASRTNTLFSIPMLFFMVSSTHLPSGFYMQAILPLGLILLTVAALEVNAVIGKMGPMLTVGGVILSSLALTVFWGGILHLL